MRQLLGSKLKAYRERAGISAIDLADHVGVGRQYIHSVENGKSNFNINRYIRALEYCDVSFQQLLSDLQHSDIPDARQPYHRILSDILDSGETDLVDGVESSMRAFRETARGRKARAGNLKANEKKKRPKEEGKRGVSSR